MASATYLQSLDSVYEDGTSRGITPSNRRQIETFIASEPIVAGDLVCIDIAKIAAANPGAPASDGWKNQPLGDAVLHIKKANTAAAATVAAIGFAIDAAANPGDEVRVTVAGIHAKAHLKTGVAQGDRLKATNVAGEADAYTASETVPCIGYALGNYSGDALTPVFVIKQF